MNPQKPVPPSAGRRLHGAGTVSRRLPVILAPLLLLSAGAAPLHAGDAGTSTAPSTLPELVLSALQSHERMVGAESAVRRAHADVKLARSALLPHLDLTGRFTRYQNEVSFSLGEGQSFVIQPLSDWNYSANLSQTLFSGLRDWRARDVARLRETAARIQRLSTAFDLTLEVSQAFFDTIARRQGLEVRKAMYRQVEEQLRVAGRRFEVGEVTSADVARWTAELAAARQALVVAEGEARLAERRLARLAGVPEVDRLDPPPPVPAPEGEPGNLNRLALQQRPEMLALDADLAAAGLMIKVEQGAWLPELDANLQYFGQRADFPSRNWLSLSLNLRVPIYDGGVTAARVARAREDEVMVEVLRSGMARVIRDQADRAAITYRTAVAALEAAETRKRAAREAHRQVEDAYSAGEATTTDLLAATSELTDARISAIIAHWSRELAAIALRHAVGLPPVPGLSLPGELAEPAAGRAVPETRRNTP